MPVIRYVPQTDRNKFYFFDDFGAGSLDTRVWGYGGTAGGSATKLAELAGQIRITVGSTEGDEYYLSQSTKKNYDISKLCFSAWRIKVEDTTNFSAQFGFSVDPTHYIQMQANSYVSANWVCVCKNGGSTTQTISSTATDTNWHEIQIIGSTSEFSFFLDNVLLASITTNIPTGNSYVLAYGYRHSGGSGTRSFLVDYVEAYGARV